LINFLLTWEHSNLGTNIESLNDANLTFTVKERNFNLMLEGLITAILLLIGLLIFRSTQLSLDHVKEQANIVSNQQLEANFQKEWPS